MGHPPPPLPPLWHEEANPRAQSAERTASEALWVPVTVTPFYLLYYFIKLYFKTLGFVFFFFCMVPLGLQNTSLIYHRLSSLSNIRPFIYSALYLSYKHLTFACFPPPSLCCYCPALYFFYISHKSHPY